MNINSLDHGRKISSDSVNLNKKATDSYKKSDEKAKVAAIGDKLELSIEAIKLQPIKQKISEGFYDNPKVLEQVAKKLYDQFVAKGNSNPKANK